MKGEAPHAAVAPVPASRRNRYLTWAAVCAFIALGALLNVLDPETRADGDLEGALLGLVIFSTLTAVALHRHFRR